MLARGISKCCSVGGRRSISCSRVALSIPAETTSRSWMTSSAIAFAAAGAAAAGVANVGGAVPKEKAGRKVWLRQGRYF
jgi:hypothetical protein